ncbi:MAG: F0F1 ATP synthase subunit B [Bacteroidales bacterium]|nr:F0F1 ATP synthase subunit B [Bacteroidales bacterium]
MELVNPGIGLIFWMLLSFSILLILLAKFAWKPILNMLSKREEKITKALNEANEAREQMKQLTANNERLLAQAKDERDAILNEARKMRDKMYEEAKIKAQEEGQRIIADAKESINIEKQKAIADIKNMIAELSIEMAEDIVKSELSDKDKHTRYVNTRVEEMKLN